MIVLMKSMRAYVRIIIFFFYINLSIIFCSGHHCPADRRDSIACVTQTGNHTVFECLSIHEICDGTRNCINNEDEHLCG